MTKGIRTAGIVVSFILQTAFTILFVFLQFYESVFSVLFLQECAFFVFATICAFARKNYAFRIPALFNAWTYGALCFFGLVLAEYYNASLAAIDGIILLAYSLITVALLFPAQKLKKHFHVDELWTDGAKLSPRASKAIGFTSVTVIIGMLFIAILRMIFPHQWEQPRTVAIGVIVMSIVLIVVMQTFALSFLFAAIDNRSADNRSQ